MFRVQNNVPDVYINESRDFQLLSRLIDSVVNGVKFDIDTIKNILNPFLANDRVLELLCTRVGFFAKYSYDSRLLRYIISAFPYILKNKGSKRGILEAISVILKADGIVDTPEILIDNENYTITIYTGTKIYNKVALLDVLSYIVPIGYSYTIEEVTYYSDNLGNLETNDNLSIMYNPSVSNSQVRGSDRILDTSEDARVFDFETELENKYVGSYITTEVIGSINNSDSVNSDGSEIQYEDGRNLIDANIDGFVESDEVISGPVNYVNIEEDISN